MSRSLQTAALISICVSCSESAVELERTPLCSLEPILLSESRRAEKSVEIWVTQDGQPLTDVEVSLELADDERLILTTSENGCASFDNADSIGTYSAHVVLPTGPTVSRYGAEGAWIHLSEESIFFRPSVLSKKSVEGQILDPSGFLDVDDQDQLSIAIYEFGSGPLDRFSGDATLNRLSNVGVQRNFRVSVAASETARLVAVAERPLGQNGVLPIALGYSEAFSAGNRKDEILIKLDTPFRREEPFPVLADWIQPYIIVENQMARLGPQINLDFGSGAKIALPAIDESDLFVEVVSSFMDASTGRVRNQQFSTWPPASQPSFANITSIEASRNEVRITTSQRSICEVRVSSASTESRLLWVGASEIDTQRNLEFPTRVLTDLGASSTPKVNIVVTCGTTAIEQGERLAHSDLTMLEVQSRSDVEL